MPAELRAGGVVAGYRLLRPIGQGAQSTVFLAQREADTQAVALKLVDLAGADASGRAAFLHGTATARRLVHPAIVAVVDAGVDGTLGWLAMEPVPGTSLERYTRPARLLPEPLVLRVAEAVAQALAYAHGQGVVHRDIKPANVLVHWPGDTVKLADFGLARAADAGQTATGLVLGTPGYMAPEQLAGGVPTPASDLYALGVTLFQLLAGRLPHEAQALGELLRRVASEPAPDLRALQPGVSAPLAALVARLLAKSPSDRPADAEALVQALRAAGADSGANSR
ncbi:MAG: serine/threonine-protein kinase [Rubrivivax sp.]|nr:serine/threonine-protein kinase [Rubrivivax sp.]